MDEGMGNKMEAVDVIERHGRDKDGQTKWGPNYNLIGIFMITTWP